MTTTTTTTDRLAEVVSALPPRLGQLLSEALAAREEARRREEAERRAAAAALWRQLTEQVRQDLGLELAEAMPLSEPPEGWEQQLPQQVELPIVLPGLCPIRVRYQWEEGSWRRLLGWRVDGSRCNFPDLADALVAAYKGYPVWKQEQEVPF